MATLQKMIGREWQQITDGTQTVLVQIIGSAEACDNPAKPTEGQASHPIGNSILNVSPPTVLWIRSSYYEDKVRVVVS